MGPLARVAAAPPAIGVPSAPRAYPPPASAEVADPARAPSRSGGRAAVANARAVGEAPPGGGTVSAVTVALAAACFETPRGHTPAINVAKAPRPWRGAAAAAGMPAMVVL